MKRYQTIDVTTVAGWTKLERLIAAGWTIYRDGLFTKVLTK